VAFAVSFFLPLSPVTGTLDSCLKGQTLTFQTILFGVKKWAYIGTSAFGIRQCYESFPVSFEWIPFFETGEVLLWRYFALLCFIMLHGS